MVRFVPLLRSTLVRALPTLFLHVGFDPRRERALPPFLEFEELAKSRDLPVLLLNVTLKTREEFLELLLGNDEGLLGCPVCRKPIHHRRNHTSGNRGRQFAL